MCWIILYSITIVVLFLDILKTNKRLQKFYIILFSFFIGLRYRLGWDYDTYIGLYKNMENINHLEKGYYYLNIIIKKIFNNPQVLIFIISIFKIYIIYFLLNKFLKNSNGNILGVILYFFCPFFLDKDNSLLRQSISEAFFLIALYNYLNKKYLNMFIILLIGSFFHKSLIIVSIIFLILKIKINKKIIVIFLFIVPILSDLCMKIAIKYFSYIKYVKYLSKDYGGYIVKESLSDVSYILLLNILFLVLLNSIDKISYNNTVNRVMLNLSFMGILVLNISIFLPNIIMRLAFYYLLGLIFLLKIVYCNSKKIIKVTIVFLIIIEMILSSVVRIRLPKFIPNSELNRSLKLNVKSKNFNY